MNRFVLLLVLQCWIALSVVVSGQERGNSGPTLEEGGGQAGEVGEPAVTIDPGVRQYGVLYASDGRKIWGRLRSHDGQGYDWQLPNGIVCRLSHKEVLKIVPLPLGVAPQTYVSKEGIRTILPLGPLSWADRVIAFRSGQPRSHLQPAPRNSLGPPNVVRDGDGRSLVMGHGGAVVLAFVDNALIDVPGPDLIVVEIGGQVEPTKVAISADGREWIDVGGTAGGPAGLIDIGQSERVDPNREYYFVLIADARSGLSNTTATPGADIDAVGAVGSVASSPQRAYMKNYEELRKQYQDNFRDSLYPPTCPEADDSQERKQGPTGSNTGKKEGSARDSRSMHQ
jgi:hypothetical protein